MEVGMMDDNTVDVSRRTSDAVARHEGELQISTHASV